MDELKDRIKAVRKAAGLTQEKFGEVIGVGKMAVTYYEGGKRTPTGQSLKLISDKFGVNETWLITGEGEMKAPPTREAEIASMVADIVHCDDNFKMQLINEIRALTPEQISTMKDIILRLADVIRGE